MDNNDKKMNKTNKEEVTEAVSNKGVTLHLRKSSGTSYLYDWIHSMIFAIAIVVIILTFFVRLVDVSGTSMYETLHDGDKVIVTNFFYTPEDGDIVVISHGAQYSEPIIKRVIATEGQSLSIDFESGKVTVDGKVIDEPYIKGHTYKKDAEIPSVVPEGKVFVMGDNREVSLDSRSTAIGLIDENDIIGKAQFVAFPFNRLKGLSL
ncbi:MAG: signal peptidase I [Oscillospiraceae bacterium]|nr:signal peptidase I [Oscillospiraceae bacterium]